MKEIKNYFTNLKIRRIHILPYNNLLVNKNDNNQLIVISIDSEKIIEIEQSNLDQFTIHANQMETFIGD